jgi:hypothetical protein
MIMVIQFMGLPLVASLSLNHRMRITCVSLCRDVKATNKRRLL